MILLVARMLVGFIGGIAVGISSYRVFRYYKFKGSMQLGAFLATSAISNLVIAYLALENIMRGTPITLEIRGIIFLITQIAESVAALGFASYLLDVFGVKDDISDKTGLNDEKTR